MMPRYIWHKCYIWHKYSLLIAALDWGLNGVQIVAAEALATLALEALQ